MHVVCPQVDCDGRPSPEGADFEDRVKDNLALPGAQYNRRPLEFLLFPCKPLWIYGQQGGAVAIKEVSQRARHEGLVPSQTT